jgi:hypothetical protein
MSAPSVAFAHSPSVLFLPGGLRQPRKGAPDTNLPRHSACNTKVRRRCDVRHATRVKCVMRGEIRRFSRTGDVRRVGQSTGFREPRDVVVGDFQGDGIPDMLVAHRADGVISIFRGHGSDDQTAFEIPRRHPGRSRRPGVDRHERRPGWLAGRRVGHSIHEDGDPDAEHLASPALTPALRSRGGLTGVRHSPAVLTRPPIPQIVRR